MSELLLELFSEEIPANMQLKAADSFKDIFTKYFQEQNIKIDKIDSYVTPRRITIHVQGLPKTVEAKTLEIKGPKVGAPAQAIEGFCLSNKIDKSALVVQKIKGTEYYIYQQQSDEQLIAQVLKKDLPDLIAAYTWQKSMYWGAHKIKWIRPLQNILCILDGAIVDFEYGHLKANNISRGHRFMSGEHFEVKNFADYQTKLTESFVILDQNIRKKYIKDNLIKLASEKNLVWHEDEELLNEVTGLVEYPQVLMGNIDQKFMQLPSEVLITSMKLHQKYFSVFNNDGKFAPYFLFVANIASSEPTTVINGNEKVLASRLSDAIYFYEQDKKNTLESQREKLDRVIFHAKLGSMKDKVLRLEKIIKTCSIFINEKNNDDLIKAARICKSDLVSEMVGEFPNLQGIMGSYYAREEGYDKIIVNAIRDHYKTSFNTEDKNAKYFAACLAIIDRMDSLCGLMLAGERASGSKDPYALRRYALNIIKIIFECENKNTFIIDYMVEETLKAYGNLYQQNPDIKQVILAFFKERLIYFYQDMYDKKVVDAVINSIAIPNISKIDERIKALSEFLATPEGKVLIELYKRISNIIKDIENIPDKVDENLFENKIVENVLFILINDINIDAIDDDTTDFDYKNTLKKLKNLKDPLADFFDKDNNIMVMHENEKIKNNRLALLNQAKQKFDKIADFSKLL